ncbi:MAG: nodulation protein NfeD [Chloroflexi bacterium]|nr:MAG: nodulation protein NfeD [Chloroflexota bacterium]
MNKQIKVLIVIGLLIVGGLLGVAEQAKAQTSEVLVLRIEGPVTPAMVSYFERGIETAESQDNTAVLIILDTPGGNLDPTLDIVQLLRAASVPVIVYISPRGAQAASAGSIITMAAHVAAMSPETVIGAASPVGEGGAELGETISRKLKEDLKAQVRSLTERRGAAATAIAEGMIEDAHALHAEEALNVGLIDVVAEDVPDLLRQIDGMEITVNNQTTTLETADATIREFPMNLLEQTLHALANPLFISILLVLGVQAILIELSNPGGWVAGFIGVVALALAFYGLGTINANWLGLVLIGTAFVLFALEVKAPTHGALALTGTATMLAGILLLFNSPGSPEFARISIPSAIAVSLSTAVFFLLIVTFAIRAQKAPPQTGLEGLIGKKGVVRSPLQSANNKPPYTGTVLVWGELWEAESNDPLDKGELIIVTGAEGFKLQVTSSTGQAMTSEEAGDFVA